MSMSHEAIALRGSLIRLQAIVGIILEAGAQINEEHVQELSKYIGELGFVNESFQYERVISLINTGNYESYARPPNELIDAMAARVSNSNVAGVLSAAQSLKKITTPKEYKKVDFAEVIARQKASSAEQVYERTRDLMLYFRDDAQKSHPANPALALRHAVQLTENELRKEFDGICKVMLRVTDGTATVIINLDEPGVGQHPPREVNYDYTYAEGSVISQIVKEAKHLLATGFVQGCRQWPDNRLLAAHMTVNGTSGVLNLRGERHYVYRINLVEDTGEVLLKVTDRAGNVIGEQIVGDLLNKKYAHLEAPVRQMAEQLINSTELPTYEECVAIEHDLRAMYLNFIHPKLRDISEVEIKTFKYAANGRPFFMVAIDSTDLEHEIVFPVYME